ncbi:hypothetical protein XI00_13975 [Bradyrhizobium sp. CCBAU 21359]|nr:hypothetical protein [Bradyrhizobium sp. CCBAU 21359]
MIIQNHDLLFDLIVVVIEVDKFAILADSFQRHDITAANFETATTADALLGIDRDQVLWRPVASVSCLKRHALPL